MAKAKAAVSRTAKPMRTKEETAAPVPIEPQQVHALFGLPGPYDPVRTPPPRPGSITFWDCGLSIAEIRRKRPDLFPTSDWLDIARFAKETDSWRWRQLNLTSVGLGEPFAEQRTKLNTGDEPPAAREVVAYLVLHFLSTGERIEIPRLRCRDVLPSGRRVIVGPFSDHGLDIANVSDCWSSPGIALCAIFTPPVAQKRK